MVVISEVMELNRASRSIAKYPNDLIVEFGCFFGLSTLALIRGLAEIQGREIADTAVSRLHVYDSFRCKPAGTFSEYVTSAAQKGESLHLLESIGDWVRFRQNFDEWSEVIQPNPLHVHEGELASLVACPGTVSLLHLDLPKFWIELAPILLAYGTQLRPGGVIPFQDFYYVWSGTLMLSVLKLIEFGKLTPTRSVHTTLICRINEPIYESDVASITDWLETCEDLDFELFFNKNLPRNKRLRTEFSDVPSIAFLQFVKGRISVVDFEKEIEKLKHNSRIFRSNRFLDSLKEVEERNWSVRDGYLFDHE